MKVFELYGGKSGSSKDECNSWLFEEVRLAEETLARSFPKHEVVKIDGGKHFVACFEVNFPGAQCYAFTLTERIVFSYPSLKNDAS